MFSHVFMSGKEGCYAEFVSVLFAWFYGRVGPEGHDGEVLIASVHSSIGRESHICGAAAFVAGGVDTGSIAAVRLAMSSLYLNETEHDEVTLRYTN